MSAGAIAARLLPWRHENDRLAGILRCQIAVTGSVTDSLRDTNPLLVTGLDGWLPRPGANSRHSDQKGLNMITNEVSDGLAGILRTAIVELVRRDGPDLSARQLGVFLTCYLELRGADGARPGGKTQRLEARHHPCARSPVRVRPGASQDRSAGSAQRAGAADRDGHGIHARIANDPARCRLDDAYHRRAGLHGRASAPAARPVRRRTDTGPGRR